MTARAARKRPVAATAGSVGAQAAAAAPAAGPCGPEPSCAAATASDGALPRSGKPAGENAGPLMPDVPLAVEYWPLDRLAPFANNARTHSKKQIAEIAGSMRAFGFTNPILVGDQGDIIAGHGRLEAARSLGLAEAPVIVLSHLSPSQRRQLVLADNRIAINAGWDAKLLAFELRELADLGCDLKELGFSKAELGAALRGEAGAGLCDEDEVPGSEENIVSCPGDIWQAGAHRLAVGDCTDPALVSQLFEGVAPPVLMVTDPPYGVDYRPDWRNERGISRSKRRGKVLNDDRADWREAWALFPGSVAYVWHAALQTPAFAESLLAAGFVIRAQIIWAKPRLVIGRGDYHWSHEPAWYAVRGKSNWTGDRKQTTVWTISGKEDGENNGSPGENSATTHGTQKPVECMRRPMLNNANKGETVYDPFLGSGTSLIAAETVGRICLGIELNPVYADIAIRRWQAFTGKEAFLVQTKSTAPQGPATVGSSFASISVHRNDAQSIEADRTEADTRETASTSTLDYSHCHEKPPPRQVEDETKQ